MYFSKCETEKKNRHTFGYSYGVEIDMDATTPNSIYNNKQL